MRSFAAPLQPAMWLGGLGRPPQAKRALPLLRWSPTSVHVESGLSARAPRSLSGRVPYAGESDNVDL